MQAQQQMSTANQDAGLEPEQTRSRQRQPTRSRRNNKSNMMKKHQQQQETSVDQNHHGQRRQQHHRRRQKQQQRRKRYPWRRYIPKGTVDPITLEPLVSLEYPPFALSNEAPYEPIEVWPSITTIPKQQQPSLHNDIINQKPDIEHYNQRRIQEQWNCVTVSSSDEENTAATSKSQRQQQQQQQQQLHHGVHLFDGKALANYMISQSQFIDPYNRRDLSRTELINLDKYLERHKLVVSTTASGGSENDAKPSTTTVIEAYDSKGIAISTAGALANTVEGQTTIRRQTAQNIFDALFASSSSNSTSYRGNNHRTEQRTTTSELQNSDEDEAASDSLTVPSSTSPEAPAATAAALNNIDDSLFASEDGGLMIIDDDENPGLRDGNMVSEEEEQPETADDEPVGDPTTTTVTTAVPFYSASHIVQRYGRGGKVGPNTQSFPSLPKTVKTTRTKRDVLRSKLLGPRPVAAGESNKPNITAWRQSRQ